MPSPLGFQVILRFEDDRMIAPSPAARRRVAEALGRLGESFGLYAWACSDDHLHAALFASEAEAREFARRLQIALHRRLGPGGPFRPPRVRPINDQAHARSLLFYVLRQSAHHGAQQDRWHECNCIHDLVSARLGAPWLAARVREHFPRVTRAELLAPVGVAAFAERDGFDPEAIAAAFLLPSLLGRGDRVAAARAAAVRVAGDVALRVLAAGLEIDGRSVRRLRGVEVPTEHARVVRRQVGLRAALAAVTTSGGEGREPVLLAREPAVLGYSAPPVAWD